MRIEICNEYEEINFISNKMMLKNKSGLDKKNQFIK